MPQTSLSGTIAGPGEKERFATPELCRNAVAQSACRRQHRAWVSARNGACSPRPASPLSIRPPAKPSAPNGRWAAVQASAAGAIVTPGYRSACVSAWTESLPSSSMRRKTWLRCWYQNRPAPPLPAEDRSTGMMWRCFRHGKCARDAAVQRERRSRDEP